MIYSTKQYKNGRIVGYLQFNTGKKVYLNEKEVKDFEDKIDYWTNLVIYLTESKQITQSEI